MQLNQEEEKVEQKEGSTIHLRKARKEEKTTEKGHSGSTKQDGRKSEIQPYS